MVYKQWRIQEFVTRKDGDYKRAERMRTVIEAMAEKLKTKNISEINSFIDFILPKVYTNITAGDVFSLLPSVTSFKITDSIGWPYETKGITLDRWYRRASNIRKQCARTA